MNIEKLRAELAATEKRTQVLKGRIDHAFTELPKAVGLASVDALIEHLWPYASKKLRSNGAHAAGAASTRAPAPVSSGRRGGRKGRRYSQEVQEKVKALLAAGKTVAAVSAETGASVATINFWKRKWGMVRKRRASKSL